MPALKPPSEAVTVVGAGLVGSLLAGFLARRGYSVRVFERRPDMRRESISAGRSINLAVSVRGFYALKQVGLESAVLDIAIPMRGRMMHSSDGALTFQRYGKDDSECIYSVSRGALNRLLLTHAEASGKVKIEFAQRALSAHLDERSVRFRDERTGEEREVVGSCVIGTDGSASVIRDAVMRTWGARAEESRLDYGYKELVIPAGAGGAFQIEKNALHIWPRGTYMLIALPNLDGSFTCTLFLPFEGTLSFASLREPAQVRALFDREFGDASRMMPQLEEHFFANPTGQMVTVKCRPWNDRGRALLVGDAAHAIVPFFGQGMNCGFEDCTELDELLGRHDSFEEVFAAVTSARKANADAIADLAVENFIEMRDKVADPRFLLEKGVERILQDEFPGRYVSRYALVSFSREPYRYAYDLGVAQARMLAELCHGIERPEQVDLARAEKLIESELKPLVDRKGTYRSGA